jgi:hypothetical protein
MQLPDMTVTRRSLRRWAESAWLLLALFPWRAKAQPPLGCDPPTCSLHYLKCPGTSNDNCDSSYYSIPTYCYRVTNSFIAGNCNICYTDQFFCITYENSGYYYCNNMRGTFFHNCCSLSANYCHPVQ